jgi:hypothetical protein
MAAIGTVLALALQAQAGKEGGGADVLRKPAKERPKPELKTLTLVGRISKVEKQADPGETVALYLLTEASGHQVRLPANRKAKGGTDLDEFLGQEVQVTGEGLEREEQGRRLVLLKKIVSIQKTGVTSGSPGAPATTAPVAPPPPPAPPAQP